MGKFRVVVALTHMQRLCAEKGVAKDVGDQEGGGLVNAHFDLACRAGEVATLIFMLLQLELQRMTDKASERIAGTPGRLRGFALERRWRGDGIMGEGVGRRREGA